MTGETHEILKDMVSMLHDWEKDYRNIPNNYRAVVNRFNSYLLHNTDVNIPGNIRELIQLLKQYTLNQLGFDLGAEYQDAKLINVYGHIDLDVLYWYESSTNEDDIDQNLIRDFLMSCRKEFNETKNEQIPIMYAESRAFINPLNYIVTQDSLIRLISKYASTSKEINKIKDWYEEAHYSSNTLYSCPVCGKILSQDLLVENHCTQMCMYYRDKYSLSPKKITLDPKIKYKKLKNGIYTYTLIPAVSEFRIFKNLADQYGLANVKLYPEIDKFDISLEIDNIKVLIDVKDFKSPYELVESLIDKHSFEKMNIYNGNVLVYLVIPEHRKYLFIEGNYKRIVSKKIKNYTRTIKVVYEDELYREVGGIIDEL